MVEKGAGEPRSFQRLTTLFCQCTVGCSEEGSKPSFVGSFARFPKMIKVKRENALPSGPPSLVSFFACSAVRCLMTLFPLNVLS